MGEVYLARDQVLDREVALKVLRSSTQGTGEFAERFKREALNAAALSHPNIVQVYDRGETADGAAYIAMEYLPGGTLKERILHEGPLESYVAASIGSQVAEALDAAHARGVIHRDIKPQNIFSPPRAKRRLATSASPGRLRRHHLPDGVGDGHRELHVPGAGPGRTGDPQERPLLP
jgi:serine/threonine-protein kinase